MKKSEILKNIKEREGIGQLNAMQLAMADTEKRDILLLAPTGSGKTLAFAIRTLRNVDLPDAPGRGVSAVIIAPSRELVIQIAEVVRPIASGLKTVAFYGGHAMRDEVNSLAVAPDIIISTPGRLVDHIKRATVDLTNVKSLVLDEYDKSLDLGFYDEMRRIVARIRRPSLRILTSATRFDLASADPSQRPLFDLENFNVFDFTGNVVHPKITTEI
ncbi:MAG: DEAD/DEAH box helicase, partial [Muribaculaceae bacterium]|nr:DEAD/DEAH box helicase [Muribaculaceae bacterium]